MATIERKVIYNQYPFTMSKVLKPGKVGNFSLEIRKISKGSVMKMYDRKGFLTKGKYTFDYPIAVLLEGDGIWMSDSQLEVESTVGAVEAARGNCLIGGLGIGFLPTLISPKPNVRSIDIIEKSQDVIDLIYHQVVTSKTRVFKDDIYHYLETTSLKYDFVHIDIWTGITAPIKEIEKARLLSKRVLKSPRSVTWVWLQELCDRVRSKLPKEPVTGSGVVCNDPCLICGKTLRYDFAGLCMDCADFMGLSNLYIKD